MLRSYVSKLHNHVRNEPVKPWVNLESQWCILPGFASNTRPVHICRVNHPEWRESMRLFGIDDSHSSRLEKHPGFTPGWLGPGFNIQPTKILPNGIPLYILYDPAAPPMVLSVQGNALTRVNIGVTYTGSTWMIVPRFENGSTICDGWDIINADSKQRLDVTANGSLALTDNLTSYCHWDILHPFAGPFHCPDFWMPHFFSSPFDQRRDVHALATETVKGVINPHWKFQSGSGSPEEKTMGAEDCITSCANSLACSLAVTGANNTCILFNAPVQPLDAPNVPLSTSTTWDSTTNKRSSQQVPSDIHGDYMIDTILLAHRVYGDKKDRFATAEFLLNWLTSVPDTGNNRRIRKFSTGMAFAKDPSRVNSIDGNNDAYRTCLINFGVGSKRCRDFFQRISNTSDPVTIKKGILGGKTGICTGPNLRSEVCQAFCREDGAKNSDSCKEALLDHCQNQTEPGRQEDMCSCWMPGDSYKKAWASSVDQLSKTPGGNPDVANILKDTMSKMQNPNQGCWYEPAFFSRNEKTAVCSAMS